MVVGSCISPSNVVAAVSNEIKYSWKIKKIRLLLLSSSHLCNTSCFILPDTSSPPSTRISFCFPIHRRTRKRVFCSCRSSPRELLVKSNRKYKHGGSEGEVSQEVHPIQSLEFKNDSITTFSPTSVDKFMYE
ncbi:hypothetical protein L1887_15205 [Cichorium endivia]|nr:hypothetical protein L1887_15205 [Cichorium endivia]